MIPIVTIVTTSLTGLCACFARRGSHSITLVSLTLPRVSHYVRSSACAPANSHISNTKQELRACVRAGGGAGCPRFAALPLVGSITGGLGAGRGSGGGGRSLCVCVCACETEKCPATPPSYPRALPLPSPDLSPALLHLAEEELEEGGGEITGWGGMERV